MRITALHRNSRWLIRVAAGALACCSGPIPAYAGVPIQRLAEETLAERREAMVPLLEIPADDAWIPAGGAIARFDQGTIALQWENPTGGQGLYLGQQQIDTRDYTELRISLRCGAGQFARLTWESDREPVHSNNPGAVFPIFADGEWHTYTVPLQHYRVPTWAGVVSALWLSPSDGAGEFEIGALALTSDGLAQPRRFELEGVTIAGFAHTPAPWKVQVPADGVLDLQVGMHPHSYEHHPSDGVTFSVSLERDGVQTLLAERTLRPVEFEADRKWRDIRADLRPWAGREVTLHFGIAHGGTAYGDYYLWGNPCVYAAEEAEGPPPVVLISCDTLRADHLSCYGYGRETTPNLDRFAAESVLFEHCIVSEAWTLPSHMSMLTGLHSDRHGVTPSTNLPESTETISEWLAQRGYRTGAFVSVAYPLYGWRGFAQGFDRYDAPAERWRDIYATASKTAPWLQQERQRPFFLFCHNFDIHGKNIALDPSNTLPYHPPNPAYLRFSPPLRPPGAFQRSGIDPQKGGIIQACNAGRIELTAAEKDYLAALYDDAILNVDAELEQLFQELRAAGVYDKALIIVTADHGEAFGEWRRYGHSQTYEPLIHVPLIVKFPGGKHAGTRVAGLVQNTDIFATVTDAVEGYLPEGLDSVSLARIVEGSVEARETAYSKMTNYWWHEGPMWIRGMSLVERGKSQVVRTAEWKYHRDPQQPAGELYHLGDDPGETRNVLEEHPDLVARFERERLAFFRETGGDWYLDARAGAEHWTFNLSLSAGSGSLLGARSDGAIWESFAFIGEDGQPAHKTFTLKPYQTMQLYFRCSDTRARVQVDLDSPLPVRWIRRTGSDVVLERYLEVIAPAESDHHPLLSLDQAREYPVMHLWHVPEILDTTPAQEVPEEAAQELRALGYL